MNRFPPLSVFFVFALLFSHLSNATIVLDGILSEPEWENAQQFNQLMTVSPYTLAEPEFNSEILVFSDENGIYFGIKNRQPIETRNTDVSARDMGMSSDKNLIVIDFDNNGHAAYSFEIGSGSSIRDGIWNNENVFSSEWDGNWKAQTSSNNESWLSEVYIPWDIVSMKKNNHSNRTVNWYFSRTIAQNNQVYATVPTVGSRQGFITSFSPLVIQDFVSSSFQFYSYATARQDILNKDTSSDVGVDLFWKSGGGQQLSLTVNPDFGQIESDNLVVNFSPTEVFFNERRPFFTENQSLFDIRGANGLRLLNTRRIGARPDIGNSVLSDIDGAIKYTNNAANTTFGVLAASESGAETYDGRDFLAARFLRRFNDQSIGFLGTSTDRPDINRLARVYSLDHEYRWNDKYELRSQVITTDVNQDNKTNTGSAGSVRFEHQINENTNQRFELSHYTKDFEVTDFGYLPRNNINTFDYYSSFKSNNFNEFQRTQEKERVVNVNTKRNNSGVKLGSYLYFSEYWRYKNSSSLGWSVQYFSSGKDDLFSRGNGIVNTGSGYIFSANYSAKNRGKFRYHGNVNYTDTFTAGNGLSTHIHPSYYFTDNYNVSLGLDYTSTNNWLNWKQDDIFGRYKRQYFSSSLDFSANFSQKQELRLRFQWIAFRAEAQKQLTLNQAGNLSPTNLTEVNDFSISNTKLQIRYRYEIGPLSNLYVVYSRSGNQSFENDSGIVDLFDSGINNIIGDNFLVKIRYKFF